MVLIAHSVRLIVGSGGKIDMGMWTASLWLLRHWQNVAIVSHTVHFSYLLTISTLVVFSWTNWWLHCMAPTACTTMTIARYVGMTLTTPLTDPLLPSPPLVNCQNQTLKIMTLVISEQFMITIMTSFIIVIGVTPR